MIRLCGILAVFLAFLPGCKNAEEASGTKQANETAAAKASDKTADKTADKTGSEARAFDANAIFDVSLTGLDGKPTKIADHKGKALLIVNVASKCGLTPQYETLERLQRKYGKRGFTVLGFPCNQFGGQEPGSSEEIAEFCSSTYGVSFPMFEKIEVNGADRHPVYKALTELKDANGNAGDIKWNFEKFVIAADGKTAHRFRPKTVPDAPTVIAAIEAGLPAGD